MASGSTARTTATDTVTAAVSIIIVTWNGWSLLKVALDSLVATGQAGPSIEVVVIDNGSTDETAARLEAEFPTVRYLPQTSNLGFARANNIGAKAARGELVLLLNNDTIVEPGAIDALIAAANAHEDFDIFVPEMRIMRAPAIVDNRGIYLDRAAHFRQLDSGAPVTSPRAREEVFGASGGACLIRRRVIERIGLFDEALESYLEDADFAARARAAGFRALFVPESVILHAGSATGQRIADRKFFLIQRNMWGLRLRWFATAPWRPSWWLGMAYEFFHAAKAVRSNRWRLWLSAKGASATLKMPANNRTALLDWVGVKARPLASRPQDPRTESPKRVKG